MDLDTFYRRLLVEQPDIGSLAAITNGLGYFGRRFGSPTVEDHRSSLASARSYLTVCACCAGRHGRPLAPGEHCDGCDRGPGHDATPPPVCGRCATGHGDHDPGCARAGR